jgi:hypothetical protein
MMNVVEKNSFRNLDKDGLKAVYILLKMIHKNDEKIKIRIC